MKTALLLIAPLGASLLAQQSTKVTGMFSNMRYSTQSGDLIGMEVFIVVSNDGYSAVVQVSEGAPAKPVVVPVAVNGTTISFTLPSVDGVRFTGQVTTIALVGQLGGQKVSLCRGNSYWQ